MTLTYNIAMWILHFLLSFLFIDHAVPTQTLAPTLCSPCVCTHEAEGCLQADCTGKTLTSLPPTIPENVCSLILRVNKLETLYDYEFLNFTRLMYLDVSVCQLRQIEEHAFDNLSQLQHLDLSSNYLFPDLNDTDLKSVFEPLHNLKFLNISINSYLKYPGEILQPLASLEYLVVDGLANESFGHEFENLRNLNSLKLLCAGKHRIVPVLYNDTFQYLGNLRLVNASHCNINTIEPGTFLNLTNIETLDLSGNRDLHFSGVQNATYGIQHSNVRRLLINEVYSECQLCVMVKREHVQYLQNTSLEEIQACNNRIEVFEYGVSEYLPRTLRYITSFSWRLTRGPFLSRLNKLKGLTHLDLSGRAPGLQKAPFHSYSSYSNMLGSVDCIRENKDNFCGGSFDGGSVSHIEKASEDRVATDSSFKLPPNLTHFKYTYGGLAFLLADMQFAENKLEYIDVSSNIFTHWLGPITGLENITYLDLSNNIAADISPNFFENFSSLMYLNISRNFLDQSIIENNKGNLFQNLTNLKVLNASKNDISVLNSSLLFSLKSLVELDMSNNSIYTVDLNSLETTNLKTINISNNQIKWIAQATRAQLEYLSNNHTLYLDLTGNPVLCNCFNLAFIEWLISPGGNVKMYNLENYVCLSDSGQLWNFKDTNHLRTKLKEECSSYLVLSMSVLTVVVLITSVILSAIGYRYRWKLMYWYYAAKLSWKKRNLQEFSSDDYQCQAYISYADEDLGFVRLNMIHCIEDQRNLKLNIRDRDSAPGVAIAENIIKGIQNSKKTIVLLSEHFLKNKWCQYEMHSAVFEGVSRKKGVVITVMLQEIRKETIPPEIMYHVQNNLYLECPEEEENMDLFWNDLTTAILA